MKILIVEDEERMARLLRRGLQEEGHSVDLCAAADAAADQALDISYDVILLDWMLPDQDGLTLLRGWRQRGLRTPVMMLTARGTTGEKVTGLRAGADDFMAKPFDFEELLARIEALHRRGGSHQQTAQLGSLTLDARRRVLQGPMGETPLTAREFELLSELSGHRGEVLTRSRLLSTVWGTDFEGSPNVVDVYVGYLRAKIDQLAGGGVSLQTVRGIGYRLVADSGAEGARK